MRFKNLTVIMVATMALAGASSAFAIINCQLTSDDGNGEVTMPVTITGGLASNVTFNTVGAVTVNINDCLTGATSCSLIAQGTPGNGLPQLATFTLVETGGLPAGSECAITKLHGLPVELSKFSVE